MFSIEQVQAFVITVNTGSFSAAARQLGKAQSVISQHIMNLEIDCNSTLFERTGRYPQLTLAGEKFLPHAQALLNQHQRLLNSASALSDSTPDEMTIALDEGIPFRAVTKVINQLQSSYPNVTLEFLSASSLDIIDLLTQEKPLTGIIFSELNLPTCLDFESTGSISFDLYVAKSHPLAAQVVNNIDSLRLHRQLLIRSRNAQASSFQLQVSPDVLYADNYYLLLELTLQGHGWCLLPEHVAQEALEANELIRLPIEFEKMQWQANVDVLQHQKHSSLTLFKLLRKLLRDIELG
ncbi:LysR family transcriptional regulator [Marinobacter adhaerens]|uniref:LysR family transcriptional regulator n=1 Tax=Marinobacter adhaerens TaxID=1033846 RepID=A0A851HRN2_9GAMM|nr:LysR family transcriptional regulator [Marinobacter adhaerens]NWN89942.1 LysR family transcriptional regulator [Marinobacter adhaerens]